jgi:hypothetical protein
MSAAERWERELCASKLPGAVAATELGLELAARAMAPSADSSTPPGFVR